MENLCVPHCLPLFILPNWRITLREGLWTATGHNLDHGKCYERRETEAAIFGQLTRLGLQRLKEQGIINWRYTGQLKGPQTPQWRQRKGWGIWRRTPRILRDRVWCWTPKTLQSCRRGQHSQAKFLQEDSGSESQARSNQTFWGSHRPHRKAFWGVYERNI